MKTNRLITIVISVVLLNVNTLFAQNTYVPDDNFEQALIELGYDSGILNDSVPTMNIETVTSLNVNGNLTGIKDFTSLTNLNCGNNNLTLLNTSDNLSLLELVCFNNQINTIDLNTNTNLTELVCYNNNLTEINLSAAPVLLTLNYSNNQISSLDLSKNISLKYVNCSNNELQSLNLKNGNNNNMTGGDYWETGIDSRKNPDLFCIQVDNVENTASYYSWFKDSWSEYNEDCSAFEVVMVYVPDDNFEQALINLGYDSGSLNDSVPITSIKYVENLNLSYRNISNSTGIEHFTSLKNLYCSSNKISSLNLSNNTNLIYLDCSNNLLTQLDLHNNTILQNLYCGYNKLIDLDLSSNPNLTKINCYYNELTGLNVRNGNNSNLQLDTRYNSNLFCIQVDDASASYTYYNWYKNAYTAYSENCSGYVVEMTYIPDDKFEQALVDLVLDAGVLNDSVPTIAIMKLKSLNISYKNITDFTGIEDFVALEQLYCNNNQISEINLTTITNLKTLQIHNNKLSDLDLSSNPFLTSLNASSNQLTGLNLRNGNNANMSVNVQYNPDLLCIQVDNEVASYTYSNWYKNVFSGFSEDCSGYVMQKTFIPDDNFEQILINMGLDFGPLDDSVPTIGIKSLISLDVSNSSIYDLTGIEDFENIEVLNCNLNNIEFLDLSKNAELLELSCYYNKLATLDLQSNLKLTKVDCQSNPLVSINLSKNINLEYLNCAYCQLTNLNLQNNDKLVNFSAQKNPPLCILVNNIDSAEGKTNWYIDDWSNYSLDCSDHIVEKVYMPDDNFEKALINMGFDFWAPDDSVYKAIAETFTSLSIYNNNIKSLEGIEFFSSLEELNINNNEVSNIDLSHFPNLRVFKCNGNALDSLDLFTCKKLFDLDCSENQLNELNLDSCIELQNLTCSYNNLQNLYLSNNLKLANLSCRNNQITELDIASNSSLVILSCNFNQITSLDLKQQSKLEHLACNSNNLSELNLSENTLLKSIYCGFNQITTLDLYKNSSITYLNCENGLLTSLNLQNGNNNILRAIDIINNPNLFCVQVDDPVHSENHPNWDEDQQVVYSENCSQPFVDMTYVPDDNFERALIDLGYDTWPLDDSVLTAKINTISYLDIDSRNISDLTGIEDFIALSGMNCSRNKLNALNLSTNTALTFLYCEENQINTLNFGTNAALERLYCHGNQLTELEISNNNNLEVLHCNINQLSSIDLSDHTALMELNCTDNNLTHLNIKNGNNNNISYFSTTGNKNLFCIQVDDPEASLTYSNWLKDSWASYLEDCGQGTSGIPISEYNALVELYNSMDGNNWTLKTNWLDTINFEVNDWYGITVENNHVTAIQLQNNFLTGYIPAELKNLKSLSILNLSSNRLGPRFSNGVPVPERCIPNDLSEIKSLRYFNVRENQFMFNDIEAVFKWSNFSSIENYIYGGQYPLFVQTELWAEPNESFIISNLNYLPGDLDTYRWEKNNVPIPGATGKDLVIPNPQLSDEGIYVCRISNSLATGYEIKTSIIYLKVNDVHGAGVPLSEYLALKKFYETNNGKNWFQKENWLDTITCTVGDWHGIQVKNNHVQWIALDSCNISGALPKELIDLKHLEEIHFHANNISGSLPNWINKLSKLMYIIMTKNNLTGAIPSEIGQLRNLKVLELDKNKLEGVIPLELKNNTNLNFLSLSNNKLTGSIPAELANLGALWSLNLERNSLSGTVPASFGDLVNLSVLDLSHNQLVGPLPVELKKLQNISRFDIDNNLIGQIDWNKSTLITQNVQTDSNRQIPDEMADLLELDTLYLGGNNLQFNDIEAIFSWENFESFDEFVYAPQDSIGVSVIRQATSGENLSLTIDNYFPGPSDRYQWYKNGISIPGATSEMLNLNAIQILDSGKYYCKITNLVATGLTLYSRKITVRVYEGIKGAGVPFSEYEALVAIYNSTNGSGWTNNENWLDTVNHSVNEWFGITIENGKVTTLDLSGLNLEGDFLSYFTGFDSLKWLDLSNNKLSGKFSGIGAAYNSIVKSNGSSNQILKYLDISNNNFVFAELEPVFDFFKTIDTFIYAPQSMVGLPFDTTIYKNQPIIFKIANYTPGNFDSYSWSKDGAEITDADEITFVIQNAAPGDSGYYICSITNLLFPELTLLSDTSRLKVLIAVGTDDFNNAHFNIYPNPAEKQIFVETGNMPVNLKLFDITGTLLFGKDEFMSGWINIEQFSRGIYFVRITSQNSETITKKVIFK